MAQDAQNAPIRPVYFDRQTLTGADLNALVTYIRDRQRRHNRALVGHGVACGLSVTMAPNAAWGVIVGPGHAVLPSGEEVGLAVESAAFDICAVAQGCLGLAQGCVSPEAMAAPAAPSVITQGARAVSFADVAEDAPLASTIIADWLEIWRDPAEGGDAPEMRVAAPRRRTARAAVSGGGTTPPIVNRPRPALGGMIGATRGLVIPPALHIGLSEAATEVELDFVQIGGPLVAVAYDAAGAEQDRQSPVGVLPGGAATFSTLRLQGAAIRRIELTGPETGALLRAVRVGDVVRGSVWLVLRAQETPGSFLPELPERCAPPAGNLLPSRICEGYRLEVLCAPPEGSLGPDCATVAGLVCGPEILPAPPLPGEDCVVLAEIHCGDAGIAAIDMGVRRRIYPAALLTARARCDCIGPTPPPSPTPPPTPTPPPSASPTPPPSPEPTFFTALTLEPTRFTFRPTLFTAITRGPGPFDPSGPVINPVVLEEVAGLDRAMITRLREGGIPDGEAILATDSQSLARITGLSEVRVAALQDALRSRIRGGG